MNKRILIILGFVVLISGGYFLYIINLARHASTEILKEFNRFEDSFKMHSKTSHGILQEQYAKKHDPKAILLKNNSAEIVSYLEITKFELVKMAADKNRPASDNIITQKKVFELKNKLQNYKNFIHNEFKGHVVNIDSLIPINDIKEGKKSIKWETVYLEHSPLAGVMTVLTYLQNQVKTVEQEVLKKMY